MSKQEIAISFTLEEWSSINLSLILGEVRGCFVGDLEAHHKRVQGIKDKISEHLNQEQ